MAGVGLALATAPATRSGHLLHPVGLLAWWLLSRDAARGRPGRPGSARAEVAD